MSTPKIVRVYKPKKYKMLNLIKTIKQRFGMIKNTNQNTKQLLFNQRRFILEQNILNSNEHGTTSEKYCDSNIIVSLTTYDKRIYDVHLTIQSIMEQTMKANRIILWLDYSFKQKILPKALQLLQKKGLEICYCKDIRSYKKLIPSLQKFPDDVIITIDDDVIYEFDILERLIISYINNPNFIYCTRQHVMRKNDSCKLLPYENWLWASPSTDANIMNFPTGVGGVLYPPHSLDKEVFNESVFLDICKYADDIWFKAMSLKNGTLSKKVYTHSPTSCDYIEIENVQDIGLRNINTSLGTRLNDKQIKAVFQKYNLYKLLK
jgi:hypothetical protein